MKRAIGNTEDILDTRDLHWRLDDIRTDHVTDDGDDIPHEEWPADDRAEFDMLTALLAEVDANAWQVSSDGVTLIKESYFVDFLRSDYDARYGGDWYRDEGSFHAEYEQLSWSDITSTMPFQFIDWDAVAEHDRSGYGEVEYDGVTYLYETS